MRCKTFKWGKQSDESYAKETEMHSFSVSIVSQISWKKIIILEDLIGKFAMNMKTDALRINSQKKQ